jgi:cell division protein FtsI (penicillin-binding protein 3)
MSDWLCTGRGRLQFMGLVFAVAFAVIAFRLGELMLLAEQGEPRRARGQMAGPRVAERADIVDRNGVLLATNLVSPSLYADARVVLEPERAAERLSLILPELSRAEIVAKLRSGRAFVWLKRNLTPSQQYQINSLGVPGLAFQEEQRRIYPLGGLAAHTVGFVDVDNNGIAGVERFFDEPLKGHARGAEPLALSLDTRVQHALRDELRVAMERFRAIAAGGVVLDVESGEILALSSLPDYDPNHAGTASEMARFNRVSLGVYELGSVFKVFNTAMALDSGKVTLKDGYDATKPIRVSRFVIRDHHAQKRWLSVPEIFVYSSNIGSAKMALDLGTERQQAFMRRLGMLRRAALELPEVGAPLSPSPWREINTMTVAFGHGLAVSPLQALSAVAAIVNGGILRPATLVKRDGPSVAGIRVISNRTSEVMRRLLRAVVVEGTAKQADVPGYLVGGKTGTAEKAVASGYDRSARITTFVGVFPMTRPRYAVLVLLDQPQGIEATKGYATAGWNAAPTAGRVIARIAPLLAVGSIDEEAAEVNRAMEIALYSRRPRRASF